MSFNVHPNARPIPPLNRFWLSRPTHKQIIALQTSVDSAIRGGPGFSGIHWSSVNRIAWIVNTYTRN